MSKQSVTQGVYEYLQPNSSNIPNLGTVYIGLPRVGDEADLFTNSYPGADGGAVIYLFITDQTERRIAMGGAHSGNKFRTYNLGMLIIFKSILQDTWQAQNAFDEFIDSLTEFIQADRTPEIPQSNIFQWGEGTELGGPDIRIDYTMPRTDNGGMLVFQAVAHVLVNEILIT